MATKLAGVDFRVSGKSGFKVLSSRDRLLCFILGFRV